MANKTVSIPAKIAIAYGDHMIRLPALRNLYSVAAYKKLSGGAAPFDGSKQCSHNVTVESFSIKERNTGARHTTNAIDNDVTTFLQREERNSVKLTEAASANNPAHATAVCISPKLQLIRFVIENSICMDVCKLSHPKNAFEIRI